MKRFQPLLSVVILAISTLWATTAEGQTFPGQIVRPATTAVINPDKNGWVTKVPNFVPPIQNGFDNTVPNYYCVNQFEYSMYGVPQIGTGDVLNDNVGNACGITDLIPDTKGYSVYTVRDANNKLIFRFRLGAFNSSVEAYSILIDADQKFGHVGDAGVNAATADPNWTAGNPGFELDITLINNHNGNSGGVFVYDIDGIDGCPTPLASYAYDSHVQISRADTYTCNDADYFFDYYVPLDSVVNAFNANKNIVTPARNYDLSLTTGLRYAALTNQNAGCSMQGKISDISGVDNSVPTYSTQSATGIYNSFLAVVNSQCGTPLNDLVAGAGGFNKNQVSAPSINGPLNVNQQTITGTTIEAGVYVKIDVYPVKTTSPLTWYSTSTGFGEVTETGGVNNWSIVLSRPLSAYDSVVATAQKDKNTPPCAANGANTSSTSSKVVTCLLEATLTATNVSCNGLADGSIVSTLAPAPNNGTAPYTYSWTTNPVQTSPTAMNLGPGTYSLTLKDSKGCQAILNPVSITQPAALSATLAFTNVTCNGAHDGTITVSSPAGGYGTYQYTINGGTSWQTSGTFTGLANGTYTVMMRDGVNTACVTNLSGANNTTITQPGVLSATVATTSITCSGANDATITISAPTGGSGSYEFSINGGTNWVGSGAFASLPPATYNVLMRDALHPGCQTDLDGISNTIMTQPTVLSATVASTNISCNGAHDGTITVTNPAGGSGNFEYSINGGGAWLASGSFTGLAPATYNILIRDAAHTGCHIDLDGGANTILTQPSALSASLSATNVTCNGAADGTITISGASGGSGNFQYSINGGANWGPSGSFAGLANGTYDVQVRDASHTSCSLDLDGAGNTIITQPGVLNASVNSTNVTANGGSDGTITISSATGGSNSFEYTINGTTWLSSGAFTGLPIGTYHPMVRDAAHHLCIKDLGNVTITQPATLSATVNTTNVTCFGGNDGAINITAPSGGSGSFEYSIDGGLNWSASGSFASLPAGTHNILIRDLNQITDVIDLDGPNDTSITQPAKLSATVTSTNITCNGFNDGSISISSPAGGSGNYEFSIDGGGGWSSSVSYTGLSAITYNVIIRDALHPACTIDLDGGANTVITQPNTLAASRTATNISCSTATDGSIVISGATGGSNSFEYSINGGTNWFASPSFTGLTDNTYNVMVRDVNHTACSLDIDGGGNTIITRPSALSASKAFTNVSCNGASDGTITISAAAGGSNSFEYTIDGTNWQSSPSFSALPNGTYNIMIRDQLHPACGVDLDGTLNTTITQTAPLTAAVTSTNATCFGIHDGTITIATPSGGSGSYEYSIDGTNWQGAGTFGTLQNGTYNILIRDALHTACVVDLDGGGSTTILQPNVLAGAVTPADATCSGTHDGAITIASPAGGYGNFEFTINGGSSWQSDNSFTNLAPGSFNVQVRDADHVACVIDLDGGGNTSISQPAVLAASVTFTDLTCNSDNDGTITITPPTGGHNSYELSIDGGLSWQSALAYTDLANNTYDVQVRDKIYPTCVIDLDGSANTVLTEPSVLNGSVVATNVTCNGANDGTITVSSPLGGYGTYDYSVDGTNWFSAGSFTGIAPAVYNVFIRDRQHTDCIINLNGAIPTTVTEPTALSGVVTSTYLTSATAADGTITVSSSAGGYGTYDYSIDGGVNWQSSPTFGGLTAGAYNVLLRDDANPNCTTDLDGTVNTLISIPPPLNASIVAQTDVQCLGANTGSLTVAGSGGVGPYTYSIDGVNFFTTDTFSNLTAQAYVLTVKDAYNYTTTTNATINQPSTAAQASVSTLTDPQCFGGSSGSITLTGTNGTPGYLYSMDGVNYGSNATFNGLAAGPYVGYVKDANGCVDTTHVTIAQPAAVAVTATGVHVTFDGATTIAASATGGTSPYTYSWTGPGSFTATTDTIRNLEPGVYTVTATDANQCTSQQPASFNAWVNHPPVADNQNVTLPKDTSTPVTLAGSDPDGNPITFVIVSTPSHGALTGTAPNLTYTPTQYYYGPDEFTFMVQDSSLSSNVATVSIVVTDPFKVYEGVSPNGDGKNDFWIIDGIESYPNNSVKIFDRYNNLVFETTGYSNESNHWYGQANHGLVKGTLPDGPYFYSLSLGNGTPPVNGFVALKKE